ncbi:hypothetical protein FH972_022558 [Carpinus fangiana]|uniref:Acyl-CoA dehydrogenase/oxidase C-terminal domain-containing protein n=1 Tax=Carpinus fangiana TaxID=176857 RepID=A0A5N6KUU9_9ROSI|nr:hypothetical protein FH972_022558 [Carpinus fangiana]
MEGCEDQVCGVSRHSQSGLYLEQSGFGMLQSLIRSVLVGKAQTVGLAFKGRHCGRRVALPAVVVFTRCMHGRIPLQAREWRRGACYLVSGSKYRDSKNPAPGCVLSSVFPSYLQKPGLAARGACASQSIFKKEAITQEFPRWGTLVLSAQVLRWLANAEAQPPTLGLRDSFGSPRYELTTSEGWRALQNLGLREGIVAIAYEKHHGIHSRMAQFLKMFLWCGSSSTVTCPSAMQDGAAALLARYLKDPYFLEAGKRKVLQAAYNRLISREPHFAWTSGQWMTERTGGSDVRGTETRARKMSDAELAVDDIVAGDGSDLGYWSVDGFKWFSSATDADMTVLLAKTDASDRVSLFFAPTRRLRTTTDASTGQTEQVPEFNGIRPQRLKSKMGTKALPTAELELEGMRAYMLGKEGQGTKEISTVLNITRVYNAVSSVGALGRGLAISRAFARVRRAGSGALLMDVPAHVRGMATQHVEYRGNMMLTYFVVYLLGIGEEDDEIKEELPLLASKEQAVQLLRLITPVTKAMTALNSIDGLRFCMESLGGLGYLENEDVELNVAKIFRDTNVLAIWEGTTDVMAADTVRVLVGRGGQDALEALESWVMSIISSQAEQQSGLEVGAVTKELDAIKTLIRGRSAPELLYRGRELLERLSWTVVTALLVADSGRDKNPIALEVAERWLAKKDDVLAQSMSKQPWKEQARLDREIVFSLDGYIGSKL